MHSFNRDCLTGVTADADIVLGSVREAIDRYSVDSYQREVLAACLGEAPIAGSRRAGRYVMSVYLPLCIAQALGGGRNEALMLAVALTLLETGIYVLDHLMDNELQPLLAGYPGAAVMTAATSLVSYLPQMAVAGLTCPMEQRMSLLALMNHGLASIAHGQLMDIASDIRTPPAPAYVERCIAGKTGARRALYARMAATLGGASPVQAGQFAAFARMLGIARQIHSDLQDIFASATSRDLRAGTCTLPLALYFSDANSCDRQSMLRLIEDVRTMPCALATIRERLRTSGALRRTLVRKEVFCARARRYLDAATLGAPGAGILASSINEISWRLHAHD